MCHDPAMRQIIFTASLLGAAIWIAGASPAAQDAAAFNKPLEKFTIGDLFPKVAAGLAETSVAWKTAGDSAQKLASTRSTSLKAAIEPVKKQIDTAKDAAHAAKDKKDFAAEGAAQGQVKTGETVLGILERLEDVSSRQEDLASAWSRAADMMKRFVDADNSLDAYRGAGIAKPAAGQKDMRLDPNGYQSFKSNAEAMKNFGEALAQLGNKINALGSDRIKFANELDKAGHIQSK